MDPKVKITSITIETAGEVFDLTIDEAKELYGCLKEFFDKNTETIYVPYQPTPIPNSPWDPYSPWITSETKYTLKTDNCSITYTLGSFCVDTSGD